MADTNAVVLTDTANQIYVDTLELTAAQAGVSGGPDVLVRKRRLSGGHSDGVDIIEVDNGAFSFTVVPTRGMGLWRGTYKGIAVGWQSPIRGPVHPSCVNEMERGGLGWLRGFDECIVRCGMESNGAPCRDTITNNMGQPAEVDLTLHGKVANTPASYVSVEVTPGDTPEIIVTGTVCETGLFVPQLSLTTRISTQLNSDTITINDTVTNMKGIEAEMQMLYHCNFGGPLLEEGSELEIAAKEVAPRDDRAAEGVEEYTRYLGPTAGYVEQCYFYDTLGDADGRTVALLRNAAADKAVALRYNRNQLPCFTQWKNTASRECGYVTGLEPATNFPNPKPFERSHGRVVSLAPGASYEIAFGLQVLDSAEKVQQVQAEIISLQGDSEKTVHREPQAGFSDV